MSSPALQTLSAVATTTKAPSVPKDGAFDNLDMQIERRGSKIVLPATPREMTEDEAIENLKRIKAANEEEVSLHEVVGNAWPLEGALALMKVLKARYGWANAVPTPGFFGPKPPVLVSLETGFGETQQVVWGQFQVPGIEGVLATGGVRKDNRPVFVLGGVVKKKYEHEVKEIANQVRQYCATHSLYKRKAIKLLTDSEGQIDFMQPPRFMDLSRIDESDLTFSDEVQHQVQTNLFTPVTRTEQCRQYGVPLKRTVLLEGPYGTGKTLTASVTAKKAVEHGWTYIYLDRVSGLKEAMIFARQYAPAVVFAEDIESVVLNADGRSVQVNDILNNIDGIDSKGQEVICIFTTNHIEKIEKAMLRPGRLDAIITVNPPDAKAAQKLVRVYSKGLIDATEDLTTAGEELKGQIPAVIREVVERSKLFAIGRLTEGETLRLTSEDIRLSAVSMKNHLELMNPKAKEVDNTPATLLNNGFSAMVEKVVQANPTLNKINKTVAEMRELM